MPLYQIYHSLPLTDQAKQHLADAITNLHCHAFTTPSIFVHVSFFHQDGKGGVHFMAGKRRDVGSNRIVGIVRTSAKRPKSAFDDLAAKIEEAWYQAIRSTGDSSNAKDESRADAERLLLVTFTPMITIREAGMAIPEAGHEGPWLKEQMPYLVEMSRSGGQIGRDFADALAEVKSREDLRQIIQ